MLVTEKQYQEAKQQPLLKTVDDEARLTDAGEIVCEYATKKVLDSSELDTDAQLEEAILFFPKALQQEDRDGLIQAIEYYYASGSLGDNEMAALTK